MLCHRERFAVVAIRVDLLNVPFHFAYDFPLHNYIRDSRSCAIGIPVTCNFRMGSTMAKNLSAERAVSVKTETPMETSFAHSPILHSKSPKGQESRM